MSSHTRITINWTTYVGWLPSVEHRGICPSCGRFECALLFRHYSQSTGPGAVLFTLGDGERNEDGSLATPVTPNVNRLNQAFHNHLMRERKRQRDDARVAFKPPDA